MTCDDLLKAKTTLGLSTRTINCLWNSGYDLTDVAQLKFRICDDIQLRKIDYRESMRHGKIRNLGYESYRELCEFVVLIPIDGHRRDEYDPKLRCPHCGQSLPTRHKEKAHEG